MHLVKIIQNLKIGKLRKYLHGTCNTVDDSRLSCGSISYLPKNDLRMIEFLNTGRITKALATGFFKLDRMASGLQKSDPVMIAGGTSTGKSALAHKMVVRYDEKIVEIKIVKHRKGGTGSYQSAFLERFTRFEKLTNVDEPTQTRKEQTTLDAKEAVFCSDTHAIDEHIRRQPMLWDNALSMGKNPARMGVNK